MFRSLVFACLCLLFHGTIYSADYYWVGDGGEWSDLNHWATTSGGTVTHSQVPTSEDNVIFDANSFSADREVVVFNNDIVFVRDFIMTAVNRPVVVRGSKSVILSSFGSLDLSTAVNWDFEGIINFSGSIADNRINFGGNISAKELYIAGEGQWMLTDDLEVDSIFQITQGGFNTNDFDIRTEYFYILTDAAKEVSLTSSTIEIWGRYGEMEYYDESFDTITAKINLTNLILNPGTSRINLTAGLTELWFTGDGDIQLYDVHFTNTNGRNYIRPFTGDARVTWNTLEIRGSTRMEGDHTIGNWRLNKNKIYRLEDGRTIEVDAIEALGACDGGITITSLRAGVSVNMISTSSINLDYATLRDVQASGGGSFNATNSTDLGNNTNWNFTNNDPVDFFWIGGSGRWLDPNHWSLTSGGTPSGCLPFGKDNAHFDSNSFTGMGDSVILNLEDVFIHDMIWDGVQGMPVLGGKEDNGMHITGSLKFDADMIHSFGGNYYFESSEMGKTIEMNGQEFNRELHFSGATADWTTLDDVFVKRDLNHNSGSINTNGNNWDVWKYQSFGDQPRHLNISGSQIDLHDILNENGYAIFRPEWNIQTNNYSIDTDGSTIEFHTSFFGGFIHQGNDAGLIYNKLIFSSYGGELNSRNWGGSTQPITNIDSCIFRARGQSFGNQEINYLEFTAGYDYVFGSNETVEINQLVASGTCDKGHILISSTDVGRAALFRIANDHTFENLVLHDIHNDGGTLTANNSIDQGNNQNWVIDGLQARTVYWVNNTGTWEDSNHWSLTSGGPGGACIPTPFDNVVFDSLSFTEIHQSVYSDNNRFLQCHDMTWENVFGFPNFGYYYEPVEERNIGTDRVQIHGSLEYDSDMYVSIYWHHFATKDIDSVITNGIELGGIQMMGYGEIRFVDDLLNNTTYFNNGSVVMRDITWTTNFFQAYNSNDLLMSSTFDNVEIHVGREYSTESTFEDYSNNHNMEFNNSTIYIDAPLTNMITTNETDFGRVISTDPDGLVIFGDRHPRHDKPEDTREYSFQFIELAGAGTFFGQFRTDTLIGAPGKTYTLEAMETAYVHDYLQLIGNNCTPIQLRSNSSGILANIDIPGSSTNVVNFIEMRDNNAIGGATFIAGTRSTDIAQSNRGWLFEDPPQYVETGFLGVDRALCENASLDLSAYNYSPGETYLWSDNSTDTIINVNQSGAYSVVVTFDNGCSIEDEIRILEPEDFNVSLGTDTIICEGSVLSLDATIAFQGVNYVWSDSTKGPFLDVNDQGEYRVYAEVDGCISSDTIVVTSQEIPLIELGTDKSACAGDSISLSPNVDGRNVRWSDGSESDELTISEAGTYWVEVEVNSCSSTDSVTIDLESLPLVNLGRDTLLCEGESVYLTTDMESDVSYTWNVGSTDVTIAVTEEDLYILTGDRDGCQTSDSIMVSFQESLNLELGDPIKACAGDVITLASNIVADTYNWSDGSTGMTTSTIRTGTFHLDVTQGVCQDSDTISVDFNLYPVVDIGPIDTMICSNNVYTLNAGAIGLWQGNTSAQEYNITQSDTYHVMVDNEGCVTSDSIVVMIQEAPILDLGEDVTVCEDDDVVLEAGVSADTYRWSTGVNTQSINVTTDGSYTLSIESGVCAVRDSVNVLFTNYPILDLGRGDTTICQNDQLLLTVGQTGLWQDGTSAASYDIRNEGLYHVVLDNNGCAVSDSIQVTVLSLPAVDLGTDTTICIGTQISVQAPTNAEDFMWEDGSMDVIRTISTDGTYWVEAYKDGCSNADSISVTIQDLPLLELGNDTTVCSDETFTLRAQQLEGELSWSDGSIELIRIVSEPEFFIATADNGCISMDSIQVDFRECIEFSAYLPNVFSPNTTGGNSSFRPQFNRGIEIIAYEFKIFDRWGGEVYSASTPDQGWNGRMNDLLVDSGVYVYFVKVEYRDDIQQTETTIKGDVMVSN